ncbi:MAG: Rne/Rng family ribonuclease [Bacteroidetes bacterium]|nr:Rne/Rng family ribonuclease [Bacteroidota bacterium]
MSNELIIQSDSSGVWIALIRNKKLVELHQEKNQNNFSVGDIYLGQVRKIMPSLNAAFVNVGYEKDAFLHYHDLGPQIRSLNKFTKYRLQGGIKTESLQDFELEDDIIKTGKIDQVLSKNQQILVQIQKEPISSKGPRISSELSLAGRYMVLVPFANQISISKKIKSFEERNRLRNLSLSIKPANFGLIVRTVAEGKPVAELHKDLMTLQEKWQTIYKNLQGAKPPVRILSEIDRSSSHIRDLLNENFTNIVTDNPTLHDELKSYVKKVSPESEKIVNLYSGKLPIFDQFGINKQIKASFGKNVSLQGGSYLVIEHTEALHVIDVNSGSKATTDADQESNALNVNMEAADEIARQLRLRDMGGIIVIDFIDQRNASNKRKVYERLKEAMKNDRAKHTILPMSKFGLIQITRQRVRPEMNVVTSEECPMCKGTGEIGSSILMVDEIQQKLEYLINTLNLKKLTIISHPYIAAYMRHGFPPLHWKWMWKYRTRIRVTEDQSYHLGEYYFLNEVGEEIIL